MTIHLRSKSPTNLLCAAVHESAKGTTRRFAAKLHFGRFRSEADIE